MHENFKNKNEIMDYLKSNNDLTYIMFYTNELSYWKVMSNGDRSYVDINAVLKKYFDASMFQITIEDTHAEIDTLLKSWNKSLKKDFDKTSTTISFYDTIDLNYLSESSENNLDTIDRIFSDIFNISYKGPSCKYTLNLRYAWNMYQLSKGKWKQYMNVKNMDYFEIEKAPEFNGESMESVNYLDIW